MKIAECTAENITVLVRDLIKEFGFFREQLISITTDTAANVEKVSFIRG